MSRPCQCGGSNEFCSWCGGTGLVEEISESISSGKPPAATKIDHDLIARLRREDDWLKAHQEKLQLIRAERDAWAYSHAGLHRRADGGDRTAQFDLAYALTHRPHRTLEDSTQAAYWYQRSARLGHGAAQTNLGVLFAQGRGVDLDNEKALFWWLIAEAGGHTVASKYARSMESKISPSRVRLIRQEVSKWRPSRGRTDSNKLRGGRRF